MQKWIEATDTQWQAAFQRDVTDVHEAEAKKLMLQYLTSLEDAITKASKASDLDGAVALRSEQKRFGDTQLFPEQDEAGDPAAVKQARAAIRAQLAKLKAESAVRTKALHAKYDQVLAQAQAQLTQAQRLDDALLVKAKRDEVAAAWISPSGAAPPATTVLKTPPATKPAAGTATAPKSAFGKSDAKRGVLDEAIAQRIKVVIDAQSFERIEPVAGRGITQTDLPKQGAILVGFEYISGTWKGDKIVNSLKPLFLTTEGVVPGEARGVLNQGFKTIKAREGFAVSGLIVNPGKEEEKRLGGFQIIFAKIQSRKVPLEKPETYKSEWIGGEIRKDAVTLGGDGRVGIGVLIVAGAAVHAIGLIVAP